MIPTKLVSAKSGVALHTERPYNSFERVETDAVFLVTTDPYRTHGTFQTATLSSATTTTITSPEGNGSIIITDVVIGAKKVSSTTLILQFNDGANQAVIISPDTINQSVNLAWSPQGRIQGWRNAAVEVVTTGANTDATVTVGYMKIESGLLFAEWDAIR